MEGFKSVVGDDIIPTASTHLFIALVVRCLHCAVHVDITATLNSVAYPPTLHIYAGPKLAYFLKKVTKIVLYLFSRLVV